MDVMGAKLIMLRYAIGAALVFFSQPVAAFFAEVKPTIKVGVDCVGKLSQLAPKLATCTIAGIRIRIWCPNGQVFDGAKEQGDPSAALARSLCNMTQVP
jgi:hypothetical protein